MSESQERVQLCAFRVGREEYAVDIARVEEILPSQPVTALPRAPVYLEGVVNLRGRIVPVIDVRKRLQREPSAAAGREKVMICKVGQTRVALIVDAVTRVLHVDVAELKPAPPLPGKAPVLGAYGSGGALTLLFDVHSLFDGGEGVGSSA